MTASKHRWAGVAAWALFLGYVASILVLGSVAADDDADEVAVVITETEGDTRVTEGGPSDSYTIALTEVPSATVTIVLSADGGIAVEPAVVTFTVATWDTPEPVTVTAVDDDVAEGTHSGLIAHAVRSTDDRYDGLDVPDVTVVITDNDVASIAIAPTSLEITEGGAAGGYRVRLTSRPAGPVVVGPDAEGGGLVVSPPQLTFNSANWDAWQNVTVSVADDDVAMGRRSGAIHHTAQSADPEYDGIEGAAVTVAVDDDDVAGVTVAPDTVQVAEGGATATYEVTLESRPVADVTIRVSSDGQTRTNPTAISFSPAAWDHAQQVTVTAEDDGVEEGDHQGVIRHVVESADATYDGIDAPAVTAVIADKRKPGVRITESGGNTRVTEGGQSDSYTIVLLSEPRDSVVISIITDADVSAQPSAITFHRWDWDEPETVTVHAVDDDVAEGTHTSVIRHTASSDDDAYDKQKIDDVSVRVTDNDTARVSVAPTSLQVAEGGATAEYELVLGSRPTDDVTVRITTDGETRTNPTAVTFGPSSWNTARRVTVMAEDDGEEEGNHQSIIRHHVESDDDLYDGIDVASVTATVIDKVTPAGVRIIESGGGTHVTEGGPGDAYAIELASRPAADATIHITSDGQTTVAPTQVTFGRDDWHSARTVQVSAVDDRRAEGEHTSTIRHHSASADPAYDGIAIREVGVTVIDNDVARVSVSPSRIEIVEGDTGAGYALALESEPAGEVTVRITTDGVTSVSPAEVRFTPRDWQEPRWISITAADDTTQQGTRTSEVRHSIVSDDAHYGALAVSSVVVTVRDNERADVVVSSSTSDITDPGGSTSFELRLTSRPKADVMIPVSASSELCQVSPSAAQLTRDNWLLGVQVVVSANVGPGWYGDEACTIAIGPASSADRDYDGRDPEDVVVRVWIEAHFTTLAIPLTLRAWPPLPAIPVLEAIDNADGRGDYTVAWGGADRADSYVLQEATDAGFVGARELYRGPDLAHAVGGRGAGRYYYRVAAVNAWGQSAWSGTAAVDVRWELEPNDDALAQANGPLVPDVPYHGALASGSDVQDYYRLAMSGAGRIEVWLDGVPIGQNYDLVVRDASLGLVGYSAELGNAGEHILTGQLPAGTYYIQVYQRSGGGSPEPYTIRWAMR